MFNLKKRLKYALGNKTRLEARDGDYKNVFCPHCAAFIPMNYRVMPNAPASSEAMAFECPECDERGAVMEVLEFEPLADPERVRIRTSDDNPLIDGGENNE